MSLPKKYKDFGKPAGDCLKAGGTGDTSYSFTTEIPSGESFTVTQTLLKARGGNKTTIADDKGKTIPVISSELEVKFAKGSGLRLDKFTANSGGDFSAAGSYSGLYPDVSVKMSAACSSLLKSEMAEALSKVGMTFGYVQKGSLTANLGVNRIYKGGQHSITGSLDALYAQAGGVGGGDIKVAYNEATKKNSIEAVNVKLGASLGFMSMDSASVFLQSSNKKGVLTAPNDWTLSLFNKWSGGLGTALAISTSVKTKKETTKDKDGKESTTITALPMEIKSEVGCKYALDDNTSVVGKAAVAIKPEMSLPVFSLLYKQQLTSAAKLKAAFTLDVAKPESLGCGLGFEFGDL